MHCPSFIILTLTTLILPGIISSFPSRSRLLKDMNYLGRSMRPRATASIFLNIFRSSSALRVSKISEVPQLDLSLSLKEEEYIQRFQTFIDNSPDPFHAVHEVRQRLEKNQFIQLTEDELWNLNKLKRNGKYYFIRNGSSIVAFVVGGKYEVGNGWKILGAHTDSPNLKIKPKSKKSNAQGNMKQLNVECYGGGLWHTWFDRDLSISGRVIVAQGKDEQSSCLQRYETRLVKIPHSVLRIPNLCIHLRSNEEREAFKVNKEDHLQPILCDVVHDTLSTSPSSSHDTNEVFNNYVSSSWRKDQEILLLQLLSQHLNVSVEQIADFELSLFDTQPSQRTGLFKEFICSSRIDNLASCYTLLESFLDYDAETDKGVTVLALFDHEEVGSDSTVGAGSSLIQDVILRLNQLLMLRKDEFPRSKTVADAVSVEEILQISKAKSFILSVDMAHAIHPNYASKHDKSHSPLMNHGLVIKSNVNQRYSTNGLTGFLTREIARVAKVPIQEFSVRNDCPCGSTIGPILSTNTGIRAVDVGMPQLSMHSIREMMGCSDLIRSHQFFKTFLEEFHVIDENVKT